MGPWKVVKGCSWVLNRWQRFVYPLSYALFYGGRRKGPGGDTDGEGSRHWWDGGGHWVWDWRRGP